MAWLCPVWIIVMRSLQDSLSSKLQNYNGYKTRQRVITRSSKCDHITPVLRELHWLPISRRIEFKILLVTFKALHGLAPVYIKDFLTPYTPTRALRSQNKMMLVIPRTRTVTYGDRSFHKIAPTLWNALPSNIRTIATQDTLKIALKTYLFNVEYTPILT